MAEDTSRAAATVRVAEVTTEREEDDPRRLPLHLAGAEGTVAVQLRTTLRRVGLGSAVARRPEVVAAVRRLPGLPGVAAAGTGGTFALGGPGWLGLGAVGVPPRPLRMRLDWMTGAVLAWFEAALGPLGVRPAMGRVEGAWCAGFSDVGVDGRKLAGLGFRVTRDWIAMRGMLAVRPVDDPDHELLVACHRLIGVEVRRAASTSLVESTGDPRWTVERAIDHLRGIDVAPSPAPSRRTG
jgi:hypothetical protein